MTNVRNVKNKDFSGAKLPSTPFSARKGLSRDDENINYGSKRDNDIFKQYSNNNKNLTAEDAEDAKLMDEIAGDDLLFKPKLDSDTDSSEFSEIGQLLSDMSDDDNFSLADIILKLANPTGDSKKAAAIRAALDKDDFGYMDNINDSLPPEVKQLISKMSRLNKKMKDPLRRLKLNKLIKSKIHKIQDQRKLKYEQKLKEFKQKLLIPSDIKNKAKGAPKTPVISKDDSWIMQKRHPRLSRYNI